MRVHRRSSAGVCEVGRLAGSFGKFGRPYGIAAFGWLLIATLMGGRATAQVNVLTAHNDIARTGQNLNETILTPYTVNSAQFGKLFSRSIVGGAYAQPLYVSQLAIPGKGTHNVVFVATDGDRVYAFDADSNGGADATPLWSVSLLTNTAPAGTYGLNLGVFGTPVIDLSTNTMYLASSETQGTGDIFRLHALDITTGAEKFGAPVVIQGSVPGTGSGSSGGVLAFDPSLHNQRPGLLLLNGVVYVGFGSVSDNGAWHGWVFSYNAATLQQIDIYCTSPNGSGGGIWMGGSGLAAEVNNPSNPYGRMFIVTGNGSYAASTPYTNTMTYSMSVMDLDLTGGVMTVKDEFTPWNEAQLDSRDGDLGSGGAVLLPKQTLASGQTLSPLVQMGKNGLIHILDRNNLGGFNSPDQVVQELQTPEFGPNNWGKGIWGSPAYWNNNLYFGGAQYATVGSREGSTFDAYSFVNGQMSTAPTSSSAELFAYPGPTPSISANGTSGAIAWALKTDVYVNQAPAILFAYDATNLANVLYESDTNATRDAAGKAVKFTTPTVANGKVYVGGNGQLTVYGLLSTPTVATPTFNPPSEMFTGSLQVAIADATPGAQIYYTTDGSPPTVGSTPYTGPITVTSNETISAIASETNFVQSASVAATYAATQDAANPVFSLSSGTYAGSQTLTITDASAKAVIYYTVDGSTPTTSSPVYTTAITVPVSETVQAFATAPGLLPSSVVSASYDLDPVYAINYTQGFSLAQGPIQFNGTTGLDDFRLQLTNGGQEEAGSAFYTTPVDIRAFTTDFTFQISNPVGDGMTFTIQNEGPTALGGRGGELGYGGIGKSVAIKFDIYNNQGEGPDSSGLYTNGADPTIPAINLTPSGVNLHSGDYMDAHVTYDGATLTITLSDEITLATWSYSWPINIPGIVGGPTAYVGFTGGSGGATASQKLTYWTYLPGQPVVPNYPTGFDSSQLALNGVAALNGTALELTNGGQEEAASAYFLTPVSIESFTTDFDFQLVDAKADGFTFVLQNYGLKALGGRGGSLGFAGIPHSVAIKFNFYNGAGQGSDSTGVYVNGASPTLPSIDLTPSGLVLASGDKIHAHITYDGATLSWTLTDLTEASHPTATNTFAINIPQTFGSNTAYVGFTAGTGGGTAVQNILDWTFSNP